MRAPPSQRHCPAFETILLTFPARHRFTVVMGEIKQNGMEAAVALLCELARRGQPARVGELARSLGIPRSSFYRIASTLADCGIILFKTGSIRPGPLARSLALGQSGAINHAYPPLRSRTDGKVRNVALPPPSGPIALSAPLARRQPRRFRIGFSNASMDNAWRTALVHAVEHATASFGESIGKLSIRHAGDCSSRQAADLHTLIDEGMDGLIVSAVDPAVIAEPMERARREGISVVLVDRGVDSKVPYHSIVWANNDAIGRVPALWLCEKLGGQGSILMLAGREGALPARIRLDAARELVAQFPGIDVLQISWTGWHRERARMIVTDAIAKYGNRIAGVWCDSGLQGAGSMEAFIAAGMRPGDIPPHTGGDLNLAYKLAIRYRVPLAAVDYPPAMGTAAVEILHSALRGNWVPQTIHVESEVIITRGQGTRSVRPTLLAEEHVRWDLPDDLVLATGLGAAYDPRRFRIHYPGNRYNRSAARSIEEITP